MNRLRASAVTVALLFSTAAFAGTPAYIGRHQSSVEDVNAIMQLTKDFRAALMDKNVKQMSTLNNINITQDGHLAWVIFDFEFVQDSKAARYGVEAWQVVKVAGEKWKILSVVWSSHDVPK